MRTCPRTCSRMRWTVPLRRSRSTTSRKTSQPTSRRSLTRNTTRHGTASSAATSAAMSHMRPSILSTSTLDKLPFCYSNPAELLLSAGLLATGYLTLQVFNRRYQKLKLPILFSHVCSVLTFLVSCCWQTGTFSLC